MHPHRDYPPSDRLNLPPPRTEAVMTPRSARRAGRLLSRVPAALRRTLAIGIAVALAITLNPSTAWAETVDPEQSVAVSVEPTRDSTPAAKPKSDGGASTSTKDSAAPPKASGRAKDSSTPSKASGRAKDTPAPTKASDPANDAPAPSSAPDPAKDVSAPIKTSDPAKDVPASIKTSDPAKDAAAPTKAPDPAKDSSAPPKVPGPAKDSPTPKDAPAPDDAPTPKDTPTTDGTAAPQDDVTTSAPQDDVPAPAEASEPIDEEPASTQAPESGLPLALGTGVVSAANSAVVPSPAYLLAGNGVTVTITLADEAGNPIEGLDPGQFLVKGTAPGVPDLIFTFLSEGTGGAYSFAATPLLAGEYTVTATVNDVTLTSENSVTVAPRAKATRAGAIEAVLPDAVSVSVPTGVLLAAGTTLAVTITASESGDRPITAAIGLAEATGNVEFLNECVLDAANTCAVQLTATRAGTYDLVATVDGKPFPGATASVTYVPAEICGYGCTPVSGADVSRVAASPATAPADGVTPVVITVWLFDRYGNPVPDVDVTFMPAASVMQDGKASTDASGRADWSLTSTRPGLEMFYVGYGGGLLATPANIVFTLAALDLEGAAVSISPGQTTAGTKATLSVTLNDAGGNPARGVRVDFGGADVLSADSCVLDRQGQCQVDVYSEAAGTFDIEASVDGKPLPGAQVTYVAGPVWMDTCEVDGRCTRAEVTKASAVADGVDANKVTVWAYDTYGNPVAGARVESWSVRSMANNPEPVWTDEAGKAELEYVSERSGSRQFTLFADGRELPGMPFTLTFVPGLVAPDLVWLTTADTNLRAGDSTSVSVLAGDAFYNPAEGSTITLRESSGKVTFPNGATCVLDNYGECQIDVRSLVPGTFTIEALVDGEPTPNGHAQVTYVAGPVWTDACEVDDRCTRLEWTSEPAIADGVSENVVTAWTYDRYGNPVADEWVYLAIATAGMSMDPPTGLVKTDDQGRAEVRFTSTKAGPASAVAVDRGILPEGWSVDMLFEPGPVDPHSVWIGTATGTPRAGDVRSVAVEASDAYGNPAAGSTISLRETSGNVTFPSGASCVLDAWGGCQIEVQAFVPGVYVIEALVDGEVVPTGPAVVTYKEGPVWMGACEAEGHCTRAEATTDNQLAGGTVPNVVTVWLFDQFGNPVPDASITLGKFLPGVTVSNRMPVTDSAGRAEIAFTAAQPGPVSVSLRFDGYDIPGSPITLNFVEAPDAPVITGPADGALTNARPVVVSGTGQPDASVVVSDETRGALEKIVVDDDGTWSCEIRLADGTYRLSAVQADRWGHASPASAVVALTVDTVAPGAPRIDVLDRTGVGGGPDAAEPGATITVIWPDGTTSATLVADNGSWFAPLPPGMISGDVGAYATDAAGNISDVTDPWLDLDTPDAPGTKEPGTGGSGQPGKAPGTQGPGTGGSGQPGISAPGTQEPDAGGPGHPAVDAPGTESPGEVELTLDAGQVPIVRPPDLDAGPPVPVAAAEIGVAAGPLGLIALATTLLAAGLFLLRYRWRSGRFPAA